MKMKSLRTLFCAFLCFFSLLPFAFAAEGTVENGYYYFSDREGNEMMAPVNAFAVRVVDNTPGDPWTSVDLNMNPAETLGLPNYVSSSETGDYCMGEGGSLTLAFDVLIYDGDGMDLYIFETGGFQESVQVSVSSDLQNWYNVGITEGEISGLDLAGKIPIGGQFRYVRLVDTGDNGGGTWPGADIDAVCGLSTKAAVSTWAEPEIKRAEENGLIPDVLQSADLTMPISRLEFAAVSVKVYEALSGSVALPDVTNPFIDCNDVEVMKAFNVGITNGTSGNTFSPDELLTREQCATMLTRVFKRVTMAGWTLDTDNRYPLVFSMPALFADDPYISPYAWESVYFMAANGIIYGIGDNLFAPRNTTSEQEALQYANATREQALVIAVRMVEKMG